MIFNLVVNIIGIVVFIAIAYLFSKQKHAIHWRSVGIMLVLEVLLAWFLTGSQVGVDAVKAAADGFTKHCYCRMLTVWGTLSCSC